MATSTHSVALFEEGLMLVDVNADDIEAYGEEDMWEAIQGHDFVVSRGLPVVIVYEDMDGQPTYVGEEKWVDALARMDPEHIKWGHELTLEWPDEETQVAETKRSGEMTLEWPVED